MIVAFYILPLRESRKKKRKRGKTQSLLGHYLTKVDKINGHVLMTTVIFSRKAYRRRHNENRGWKLETKILLSIIS